MYVRACTFEKQLQEDALGDYNNYYSSSCSPPPLGSSTVAPTRAATPQIVSATSSQEYGTLPSSVPTSATSFGQGNCKGIDDITSHENDACLVNLNTSCVESPIDLSTPPILENQNQHSLYDIYVHGVRILLMLVSNVLMHNARS